MKRWDIDLHHAPINGFEFTAPGLYSSRMGCQQLAGGKRSDTPGIDFRSETNSGGIAPWPENALTSTCWHPLGMRCYVGQGPVVSSLRDSTTG